MVEGLSGAYLNANKGNRFRFDAAAWLGCTSKW
jgi:hypothetical protein